MKEKDACSCSNLMNKRIYINSTHAIETRQNEKIIGKTYIEFFSLLLNIVSEQKCKIAIDRATDRPIDQHKRCEISTEKCNTKRDFK